MTALSDLTIAAEAFASELESTFAAVLVRDAPSFVVEATSRNAAHRRLVIRPDATRIPLHVNGQECLALSCEFHCVWDTQRRYLKVMKSGITVWPPSNRGAPLFRYEYVDSMSMALPSAHLQVHAHRDEFLFAMLRADHGKPRTRREAVLSDVDKAAPQLSNLHFPLGGPRYRPCIEDVLQLLMVEFGIDTAAGAQDALDRGRVQWRKRQVAAATRDAPAEAARVLRDLGYDVTPPSTDAEPSNLTALSRI